jgi:hypothetical protein
LDILKQNILNHCIPIRLTPDAADLADIVLNVTVTVAVEASPFPSVIV